MILSFVALLLCFVTDASTDLVVVLRRSEVAHFDCVGGGACSRAHELHWIQCESPPDESRNAHHLWKCSADNPYKWRLDNVSVRCDSRWNKEKNQHRLQYETCEVTFALERHSDGWVIVQTMCRLLAAMFHHIGLLSSCDWCYPSPGYNGIVTAYDSRDVTSRGWSVIGVAAGICIGYFLTMVGVALSQRHWLQWCGTMSWNGRACKLLGPHGEVADCALHAIGKEDKEALDRVLSFCRSNPGAVDNHALISVSKEDLGKLTLYDVVVLLAGRKIDAAAVAQLNAIHPTMRWECSVGSPDYLELRLQFDVARASKKKK